MNVPMASAIRRLRRERNITQENLASALGVTFQSVSRWEVGQAYPDMELIPKIAEYFKVSTDVLFGLDKDTVEAKRKAYLDEIAKYDVTYVWDGDTEEARRDGDRFIRANYAMLEEFPDDCVPMANLLRFYTVSRTSEIPDHLEELKEYCRKIMEISVEEGYRTEAIENMAILSDDDEVEKWLDLLPSLYDCRSVILERRYNFRNEVEECNRQRQLNFLHMFSFLLYSCIGKRDKERFKNPEAGVVGHRLALSLMDILRDPSTDVDAWIHDRAFLTLRLSAAAFGAGQKEEGYQALEQAVNLYVLLGSLPQETELSYHCPLLDMLTLNKGMAIDCGEPGEHILWSAYRPLTRPEGWEWFNCVRGEERYQAQVRRLEPYLPEGNIVEL